MKTTIHFGKIDYLGTGKKTCPVTVEIELKQTDKGEEFTASGNIWNHIKTDCYSCGQNLDTIAEYIKTPLFKKVYRLWKQYHLNGMHAGTIEQDQAIEAWRTNTGKRYNYAEVCEMLKAAGLYEVEVDGKPYKYGFAWLFRAIPESDIAEIKEIMEM